MATVNSDTFAKVEDGKLEMASGLMDTSVLSKCCKYEASSLAADDIINLFHMPKGAVIKEIVVDYDDLGAGTSLDVGDSNDVDRYIDGADTATAAGTARINAIDGRNYRIGTNAGDEIITAKNLGASATGTIKATVFYSV